jgi:hypothetical protein
MLQGTAKQCVHAYPLLGAHSSVAATTPLLLQVFAGALGSSHPRTLVAARNAQHIKHKLIKLPAEPQELLQHSSTAAGESNPAAAAAAAARKAAKAAGSKLGKGPSGAGAGSKSSSKRKKMRAAAAGGDAEGTGSSSSGLAAGTSSDDSSGTGPSRIRNKGKSAAAAASTAGQKHIAGSRGVQSISRHSVQRSGSMQERLQAVMKSRQQQPSNDGSNAGALGASSPTALDPIAEAGGGGQQSKQRRQQQPVEWREYTHLDHLGAGVFRASQQQRALYESIKPDIEAHARAGSCFAASSCSSSSGAGGVRQAGSSSSSSSGSWSGCGGAGGSGVVEMQVLLPPVVPARSASASPTPTSSQQQQQGSQTLSGSVAGFRAAGSVRPGSPEVAAAAAAAAAGSAGQLMRRGPLLDATIAKVKKPLTVEQARKLRRQQQQAAGKQKGAVSLLDKLY